MSSPTLEATDQVLAVHLALRDALEGTCHAISQNNILGSQTLNAVIDSGQ